jgi:hypothetical protein
MLIPEVIINLFVQELCGHGVCVEGQNSYTCICDQAKTIQISAIKRVFGDYPSPSFIFIL